MTVLEQGHAEALLLRCELLLGAFTFHPDRDTARMRDDEICHAPLRRRWPVHSTVNIGPVERLELGDDLLVQLALIIARRECGRQGCGTLSAATARAQARVVIRPARAFPEVGWGVHFHSPFVFKNASARWAAVA